MFGHLLDAATAPPDASLAAHSVRTTFVKLRRDVLPNALGMDVLPPSRGAFCAYTTQADPHAPPVLQWDAEGRRNPFAWYVYSSGSFAERWGLQALAFAPVVGISLLPPMWHDEGKIAHFGKSALFVLAGAADGNGGVSSALFPECLRSDLHAVRQTIEAHSRGSTLGRPEVQHAAGLRVGDDMPADVLVRTEAGICRYTIDRWE